MSSQSITVCLTIAQIEAVLKLITQSGRVLHEQVRDGRLTDLERRSRLRQLEDAAATLHCDLRRAAQLENV